MILLQSMAQSINKASRSLVFLIFIWVAVQGFLLMHYGIRTDFEAVKYINEAHTFLETGGFSSNNFKFYSIEILLIALSIKLKSGFAFAVILQLMLNAIATIFFYRSLISVSTPWAAFTATFLLIIFVPFQQYNVALQTESIFHSLLLFLISYTIAFKTPKLKTICAGIGVLILLIFTRPSGILFLPPVVLFFATRLNWRKKTVLKAATTGALLIIGLVLLNSILGSGGELDFMLPFQQNMIICGVPNERSSLNLSNNPNSISGIAYYILHNFPHFVTLAAKRTVAFFGVYRSYFSPIHNFLLMAYFFSLYIFCIRNISQYKKLKKDIVFFCVSTIVVIWLSVIVTCDDWHNRFLVTLTPFLLVLSSITSSKRTTATNRSD